MQIVDLGCILEGELDQGTVQDALDRGMDNDSSFSDVSTRKAAAAVVRALK